MRWRYRLVANGVSVVLPSSEVPRLGRLPGVRHVYGAVTYRTLAGPDAAAIRARDIPGSTLANAGAGIKIGIIDDGVDQAHPFFDPTGYAAPDGFPKGQLSFTTAKVIVARAFPPPGATWRYAGKPFDPEQSGHATHVAGIAAGNANTLANGLRISGIAPRAYIGNYKALTVPDGVGPRAQRQRPGDRRGDRGGRRRRHGRDQPLARRARDRAVPRPRRPRARRSRRGRRRPRRGRRQRLRRLRPGLALLTRKRATTRSRSAR